MLGQIRAEFQSLEGESQNSDVWTEEVRFPMFGRIRSEFQCLEG